MVSLHQLLALGFMPARDDFEMEHENEAEVLVSSIEAGPSLSASARMDTVSNGESKSAISPATSLKKDLAWAASLFTLEEAVCLSFWETKESFRLSRLFCNIAVMYFRATRFWAVVMTNSKLEAFKNW